MSSQEQPRTTFVDRARANALSLASAAITKLPDRCNPVGYRDIESYVAVRWRHAATPADSVENWITYPGSETSGKRLPKHFSLAAITHVDRCLLATHLETYGGQPAVAYRLGSAVMVGYSDKRIMRPDPARYMELRVAMGVGADDLQMVVGSYNPAALQRSAGQQRAFEPLTKGVRSGEVVPAYALPSNVPLL